MIQPELIYHADGRRYEHRSLTTGAQYGSHGRSTLQVQCPFCGVWTTVYVWSFAGSGKRCTCGALMVLRGGAWILDGLQPCGVVLCGHAKHFHRDTIADTDGEPFCSKCSALAYPENACLHVFEPTGAEV